MCSRVMLVSLALLLGSCGYERVCVPESQYHPCSVGHLTSSMLPM